METIQSKLERYAELYSAKEIIALDKKRAIDELLGPELIQALADINLEYGQMEDAAQESISELEAEIKADVVAAGESVKAERISAVFMNGRVSWDTKALDGYMAAHPEIERFRKVGNPSVSLRWAK